jgi:hypothetical protein
LTRVKDMHLKSIRPESPPPATAAVGGAADPARFAAVLADRLDAGRGAAGRAPQLVPLGTISNERPTVSHLLIRHPRYGSHCWPIIHAEANRGKGFERLRAGTRIWLNPNTREITWAAAEAAAPSRGLVEAPTAAQPAANRQTAATLSPPEARICEELVQVLRPFIGRPYAEMDCYELVVEGLKKIGVRYHGADGLKSRLLEMALADGRPANAFLNGEGLIRASGETVFTTALTPLAAAAETAAAVYAAMAPHLAAGQLLSFSTPTRGHTGVVAHRDSQWTFINSGRLDHPVVAAGTAKGVGEEVLQAEIGNWLRLARRRGEGLRITLGHFQDRKLAQFRSGASAAVPTA